ncbi:hypothetical protein PWT90_04471 [Aphanocladium album]|nr:hypothetical protein PWT90_04471 [Aphanocladium album]
MPDKLPSQREFLTNLVQALCENDDGGNSATTATRATERHSSPVADTWNSPRRRKLILTLHVIFPGLLLPALDLLDRSLVRRLALSTDQGREREAAAHSSSPSTCMGFTDAAGTSLSARHAAVYAVRSLASTLPRRGPAGGQPAAAATRMYLVHLGAWSCSCAAFAVDAYAASGLHGHVETAAGDDDGDKEEEEEDDDDDGKQKATFGGLSTPGLDAHGAENIPCCKHLLACFLVDGWEELLNAHVEEKRCSEEELAGIVAGI